MLLSYLLFDSLDGKHARKTMKLSKIGELLDHGGDAFSDAFMAVIITQAFRFNNNFEKLIILLSFQIVDFGLLWEQNITTIYYPCRDQIGLSENVLFAVSIVLSRIYLSDNFNFWLGKLTIVFYSYL